MELTKSEFHKLVCCTYSENATYYPHDCEDYQAFYMFPDEDDKEVHYYTIIVK